MRLHSFEPQDAVPQVFKTTQDKGVEGWQEKASAEGYLNAYITPGVIFGTLEPLASSFQS